MLRIHSGQLTLSAPSGQKKEKHFDALLDS